MLHKSESSALGGHGNNLEIRTDRRYDENTFIVIKFLLGVFTWWLNLLFFLEKQLESEFIFQLLSKIFYTDSVSGVDILKQTQTDTIIATWHSNKEIQNIRSSMVNQNTKSSMVKDNHIFLKSS